MFTILNAAVLSLWITVTVALTFSYRRHLKAEGVQASEAERKG